MYSLISHKGVYNEAVREYIVDFETDISELPTDVPAGSKCFVIDNSVTYMLNHRKQWIKVNLSSGNGGGSNPGGGDTPDDEVIYEGGVV